MKCFLVLVGLLCNSPVSFGQARIHDSAMDYAVAKWNKVSDPALVKARKEIEAAFAKPCANIREVWNEINNRAQTRKGGPIVAFRWALTAYYCHVRGMDVPIHDIAMFLMPAPPGEYEFTRVRFLTDPLLFPRRLAYDLGKRLLARDPSDDEVAFECLRSTSSSNFRNKGDLDFALQLGNRLLRKYPNQPRSHSLLGFTYYHAAVELGSKEYAKKALASYEKYLEMVPNRRERVNYILSFLQKMIAK